MTRPRSALLPFLVAWAQAWAIAAFVGFWLIFINLGGCITVPGLVDTLAEAAFLALDFVLACRVLRLYAALKAGTA